MDIQGELVIRDETGTPRIFLNADTRLSSIILVAGNGAELLLEAHADRVLVRLRRPGGVEAGVVAAHEEAVSAVLFDAQGRGRVVAYVKPDMTGRVTVRGDSGTIIKDVPIEP